MIIEENKFDEEDSKKIIISSKKMKKVEAPKTTTKNAETAETPKTVLYDFEIENPIHNCASQYQNLTKSLSIYNNDTS